MEMGKAIQGIVAAVHCVLFISMNMSRPYMNNYVRSRTILHTCRGEDLISYPLRNKEDNFQYGHGSQLLLCTHIGHVIILIMP